MATIKDISERAGVSMATVSRVLNKDDSLAVSDGVRNLIFEIAHELGYVPVKMRHLKVKMESPSVWRTGMCSGGRVPIRSFLTLPRWRNGAVSFPFALSVCFTVRMKRWMV